MELKIEKTGPNSLLVTLPKPVTFSQILIDFPPQPDPKPSAPIRLVGAVRWASEFEGRITKKAQSEAAERMREVMKAAIDRQNQSGASGK